MLLKRLSFGLPFRRKAVAERDDAINTEKMDEDIDKVADTLLTPMGGVEGESRAEPVDTPLPLVADEEDREVDQVAEALLTPMGDGRDSGLTQRADETPAPEIGTAGKDTAEVKDTSAQSAQPVNESPGEEASEGGGELGAAEPESQGKDGFLDNLFEQQEDEEESPIQGLIASLPDITVQEVLNAAEEVKALIHEWQSGEPGKGAEDT